MPEQTDVLGPPYTSRTFTLRPDHEGEVVATLVRRTAPEPTGRAVLHVHGFADYFFQTAAADFWLEHGYDFHALDLRKYGRSLREHQTPNYVADLATYYEELDLALSEVRRDHDHVVISAHSTGGLTVPLWLHDRRHPVAGVFLNAPWIDMHGDAFTRGAQRTRACRELCRYDQLDNCARRVVRREQTRSAHTLWHVSLDANTKE